MKMRAVQTTKQADATERKIENDKKSYNKRGIMINRAIAAITEGQLTYEMMRFFPLQFSPDLRNEAHDAILIAKNTDSGVDDAFRN